jgi:hypothetical protein
VPKLYRSNGCGDPDVFEAIKQIEALGDFGSKIQMLVKHLLYLQVNDPGSKSVVFSAWADSLHSTTLIAALTINRSDAPNFSCASCIAA